MSKIAIGADHAGFDLKQALVAHLRAKGHAVVDFGTDGTAPVDYPDFIRPTAESVAAGRNDLGIVLGGSGNGEAIVANKVRGIRCAVCWNVMSAQLARQHNNANVISLGGRMVSMELAREIVDAWLGATFEGGRHLRRIEKIENPTGIVNLACRQPVAETVERLEAMLKAKGLKIFARIDQAAEAKAAGLAMPPMVLVIFGDPKAGTPLMLQQPLLAMDLPLKALVWAAADGHAWLSYNSPEYLQQRHGLAERPFAALGELLQAAAQ